VIGAITLALASNSVAAADIVLGQSAPMSGPFASMGNDYRNGALLAFDEVNRSGGINGRRISLITLDDGYNAERSMANAKALIEEHKAICFFNHMFTNTVLASLPIAAQAGLPYVGPYTGHPALYKGDQPLLFVTRASFSAELNAILTYANTIGYRRIALVYYDNKVGEELRADVQAGLALTGHSLHASARMKVGGSAAAASAEIGQSQPDAVILGISGSDAVKFIRDQVEHNYRPNYFARSLVSSNQLHAELGPLAAGIVITQLVPSPFKPNVPVVRDYLRLLGQRNARSQPSFVELEGFINARFMVTVLRKVSGDVTRESLFKALDQSGKTDVGGYVIDFSGHNRMGSSRVELTMLRANGTFAQ